MRRLTPSRGVLAMLAVLVLAVGARAAICSTKCRGAKSEPIALAKAAPGATLPTIAPEPSASHPSAPCTVSVPAPLPADPLTRAIQLGDVKTVERLLREGASAHGNGKDIEPLTWAVIGTSIPLEPRRAIVKLLLAHGASAEANSKGGSPLYDAAVACTINTTRCDPALVKLLTASGAFVDQNLIMELKKLPDSVRAPMLEAALTGKVEPGALIDVLEALPEEQRSAATSRLVRRVDPKGLPLVHAIRTMDVALVRAMLDAGAGVNRTGEHEDTPLIAAAERLGESPENARAIIKLLLARGADPNRPGTRRQTPLTAAAREGDTQAVTLLLNAGAKINAEDELGLTAADTAELKQHHAVVDLLIARGAAHERRQPNKPPECGF